MDFERVSRKKTELREIYFENKWSIADTLSFIETNNKSILKVVVGNKSKIISNWWHPNLYKFKDKNNKYALAIGRLEQVKGFDLLIPAWKKINKELLIVGSGKEKNKLLSLIKNNNLTKKIKIIDNVNRDELYEIYRDAALLIISSRYEGGPRVALEALHLEIPVISTNVGHMDEILPKELLAKKDDQQSLKDLLEKYVDNINILNQDAVFEFITDEYSITKKINEIKKIYKSLSTS